MSGADALRAFAARHAPATGGSTEQVDAATAEVLAAFEAAGVDALLLKGPALATLLYTAREQRSYWDTDLLVAPSQIDDAEKALAALGYSNADSATDDVGGVVHAHTWARSSPDGQSMVDLHHWIAGADASPAAAWDALVGRRTWIEVRGRRAAVLDRVGQAMHMALHAAQHGPAHRRPLDELELALERWPVGVWDSAAELADEIGATPGFAAGLRLLPPGVDEASRLGLAATAELDWKIRHKAMRPRGTFHLQALAEADGLGDRLRILRRSLLPNRVWIVREHPWAHEGRLRLVAAYGVHVARAPVQAARAWHFSRRVKRASRRG